MTSYFDIDEVRKLLLKHYNQFHHFSVDTHLESIRSVGLSPLYESEWSCYPDREYEPAKALRYCTDMNIEGGKSAAYRYTENFDYVAYVPLPNGAKLIQIVIPALSLLSRSYGLDFSNGPQATEAKNEITKKGIISPKFFLESIQRYGCISCYENIPASEFQEINIL